MNEPENLNPDSATVFEQKWRPALRGSLIPSGEEMLALYAGALPQNEAEHIRERIRSSPQALRDYALMTEQTLDQVRAKLQPEPTIVQMAASVVAGMAEMVRRVAQLLEAPPLTPVSVFRGDEAMAQQTYDVPGEPAATVLVEQAPVALRRYRVTGQIIFDDATHNTHGDFLLSYNDTPQHEGEVSEAGSFDLGTLNGGIYRLEITVQSQVVDLRELRIGDVAVPPAASNTE